MVSFHLTSAILFGEILYAKVQRASGRQVSLSLTVPGYSSRQPSTNRRFGYSALSCHCLLVLFVLCSLSVLHKNHSPTRSRKSFDKRENKNNVQQLNFQIHKILDSVTTFYKSINVNSATPSLYTH